MFYKYNAPAFFWAGVILFLTLNPWMPSLPQGPWNFSGVDLVAHLIVFSIQSFLLTRGFEKQNTFPLYKTFSGSLAMTYSSLFGIFIEVLQYYIPNRYFEFFDILADIAGSILGYAIYRIMSKTGLLE